jgi:hypothetical protein
MKFGRHYEYSEEIKYYTRVEIWVWVIFFQTFHCIGISVETLGEPYVRGQPYIKKTGAYLLKKIFQKELMNLKETAINAES